jgi:hypothetical protein
MREIKFRAWDGERMLDNWLFIRNDPGGSRSVQNLLAHAVDVMQFTGLHDKNGKEIYEGDILQREGGRIDEVEFESGCFVARHSEGGYDFISDKNYFQIIGNVFENPELLTSK